MDGGTSWFNAKLQTTLSIPYKIISLTKQRETLGFLSFAFQQLKNVVVWSLGVPFSIHGETSTSYFSLAIFANTLNFQAAVAAYQRNLIKFSQNHLKPSTAHLNVNVKSGQLVKIWHS